MLYLVISGAYMKVGFSENESTLKRRLKTYKEFNPSIKIIGFCDGDFKKEKEYHRMYSDNRYEDYSIQYIATEWGIFSEKVYNKFIDEKTFKPYESFNLKDKLIEIEDYKIKTLDFYKAYMDIFRQSLRMGNMLLSLDVLNKMVAFEFSLNPPQQDAVNKLPKRLSPIIFNTQVSSNDLIIKPYEEGWVVGYCEEQFLDPDYINKNSVSVDKGNNNSWWYIISHASSIEMAALRLYVWLSDNSII